MPTSACGCPALARGCALGNVFGVATVAGSSLYPADGGQAVYQVVPGTGGITWLTDADLAKKETFNVNGSFGRDGSMTHTTAVSWIAAMNEDLNGNDGWLQQTDWTFPTQNDLARLYQALGLSGEEPVVPVPDTTVHGFDDIQPYLHWSCAGSSIVGSCGGVASAPPGGPASAAFQWNFSFGNGFQGTTSRRANVRDGLLPQPFADQAAQAFVQTTETRSPVHLHLAHRADESPSGSCVILLSDGADQQNWGQPRQREVTMAAVTVLVEARGLTKRDPAKDRKSAPFTAVDGIDFSLRQGRCSAF